MQSLGPLSFRFHKSLTSGLLYDVLQWNLVKGAPLRYMAGHSKWANIKHTKAANDIQRMRTFGKISRMMKAAVKVGGGSIDPKINSNLRRALEIARSNEMPVATLESILKSCKKSQDDAKYHTLEYQGPNGVFVVAEVLTDKVNRLKTSVDSAVKKYQLKESKGKARRMFYEKGVLITSKEGMSYEQALDTAIEIGAEDVAEEEENFVFTCASEDFNMVMQALEGLKISIESADIHLLPSFPVTIPDENLSLLQKAVQKIEDIDEVIKVYTNV